MTAFNTQTCNYPRVVSVNIWLDLVSLHLGASNLCIVDGQRGRTDEPMTKLSDMTQPLRPPLFSGIGTFLGRRFVRSALELYHPGEWAGIVKRGIFASAEFISDYYCTKRRSMW